jgi:hypothetical protein
MGICLDDKSHPDLRFDPNFWHWRAIVEAVRRLRVLPEKKVDDLHVPYCGYGLTRDEARAVASAIRSRLLPSLEPDDRLLLRGETTKMPDDGVMHYEPDDEEKNYSTNRRVLEEFADFCEKCDGFTVM